MKAQGSRRYLAYIKEVTEGVVPSTPTLTKIRNTGGNGINNERTSIESAEIRNDRGISDVRLGQNNPGMTVPIEFSYGAFDALLEGALADTYQGGVKLASIVVDFTAVGSIITAPADWSTYGVRAGDFITIANAADAGNNGTFYVYSITADDAVLYTVDKVTPAVISSESTDTISIFTGAIGGRITCTTNTLTVNATAKTITAGSTIWLTLDVKVGDWVHFQGFTNAGNNGWHRVTAVTGTVLTLGASTLTNETNTTATIDIGSYVGILKTNQVNPTPTFTIEEGFDDIDQFQYITGAKVDSFKLSFQPDSMVTGEFALKAMKYFDFSGTSIATALAESVTNMPFDSYTGTLKLSTKTEASAIISGLDFNLSNSLNPRFALMSKDANSIGEGRQKVNGSVNAYFEDDDLISLFTNETEFELEIAPRDVAGNIYYFTMPRCKFSSSTRDITENDVTSALDFMALVKNGTTLVIRKNNITM
jgi:hypothetical protein